MPHNGSGLERPPRLRPRRPERALAVAALGTLLFAQPFLGIFDKGAATSIAGIPGLFAYLFGAWLLIILMSALVMETQQDGVVAPDIEEGPGGHQHGHAPPQTPRPAQADPSNSV